MKTKEKFNYYNIVRKNIRKYRKENGLTIKELAKIADLSSDFLAEIENEKRGKNFSIDTIGKIADALEVPITKFFEVN